MGPINVFVVTAWVIDQVTATVHPKSEFLNVLFSSECVSCNST